MISRILILLVAFMGLAVADQASYSQQFPAFALPSQSTVQLPPFDASLGHLTGANVSLWINRSVSFYFPYAERLGVTDVTAPVTVTANGESKVLYPSFTFNEGNNYLLPGYWFETWNSTWVNDFLAAGPAPVTEVTLKWDALRVTKNGSYYPFQQQAWGSGTVTVTYNYETRDATPPTDTSSVQAYSPNCDSSLHAYYLHGVDFVESFMAYGVSSEKLDHYEWRIDEGVWQTPGSANGSLMEVNVGKDIPLNGSLYVRAIQKDGQPTRKVRVNCDIVNPPPFVDAEDIKTKTELYGRLVYKAEKQLHFTKGKLFPVEGFRVLRNSSLVFNLLKGSETLIDTQGYAKSYRASLSEVAGIQDGWEVTRFFSIEPKLGFRFNWRYDKSDAAWEPGGTLDVGLEGNFKFKRYWLLGYVPTFVKVTVGTTGDGTFDLSGVYPGGNEMALHGSGSVSGSIGVYAGVGLADYLSVGITGKGTLTGNFGAENHPIEPTGATLDLKVGIRGEFLIFNGDAEIETWHWTLAPSLESMDFSLLGVAQKRLDQSKFTRLMPRVSKNETPRNAPGSETEATVTADIHVQNVYPHPSPNLTKRAADEVLLWLDDDPARTSENRTQLMMQRRVNGSWTAPIAVDDDGTADFCPQTVLLSNGDLWVTWQNTGTPMAPGAVLDDFLLRQEIKVARITADGAIDSLHTLTSDNFLDSRPRFAQSTSDALVVCWIKNDQNKILGSAESPDSLMCARLSSGNWLPVECAMADVGLVLETASAVSDTDVYIYFSKDVDGDLSTLEDTEIFSVRRNAATWMPPVQLTTNDVPDTKPLVGYSPQDGFLAVWSQNGALMASDDMQLGSPAAILDSAEDSPAAVTPIRQAGRMTGVAWTDDDPENGSVLHASIFEGIPGAWGKAVQQVEGTWFVREVSAVMLGNGKIEYAFAADTMSTDTNGLLQREHTDLMLTTATSQVDLRCNAPTVTYNTESYGITTVTLSASMENLGGTAATNAVLSFYSGDPAAGGVLIGSVPIPLVKGGDSATGNLFWELPYDLREGSVYTVAAAGDSQSDADLSNNTASARLFAQDFSIGRVTYVHSSSYLWADVTNVGHNVNSTGATLFVYEDSKNTPPIASRTLYPAFYGFTQSSNLQIPQQATGAATLQRKLILVIDEAGDDALNNNVMSIWIPGSLDTDGDGTPDAVEIEKRTDPAVNDFGTGHPGPWSQNGSKPWTRQSEVYLTNQDALSISGLLRGHSSAISTSVDRGGVITFAWCARNSSDASPGPSVCARFLIDGVLKETLTATRLPIWTAVKVSVPPGTHVLAWEFQNGCQTDSYAEKNSVWLDNIVFLQREPRLFGPVVSPSRDSLGLLFQGESGSSYMLQQSYDLLNWSTIKTDIPGADSVLSIDAPMPTSLTRGFYRISPQP